MGSAARSLKSLIQYQHTVEVFSCLYNNHLPSWGQQCPVEKVDTVLILGFQESTLCSDEHGIKGNSDMVSEAPCRSEPSLWLRHSPSPGETLLSRVSPCLSPTHYPPRTPSTSSLSSCTRAFSRGSSDHPVSTATH